MSHYPVKAFPLQQQSALLNVNKRIPSPSQQQQYHLTKQQQDNHSNNKRPSSNMFIDNFSASEEGKAQMQVSKSSNFIRKHQQQSVQYNYSKNSQSLSENTFDDQLQQINGNNNNSHKRTQSSIVGANYGLNNKQQKGSPNNVNGSGNSFINQVSGLGDQFGKNNSNTLNKSQNGRQLIQNELAAEFPKTSSRKSINKILSSGIASPPANRFSSKGMARSQVGSSPSMSSGDKLPKLDTAQNNTSSPILYHHPSNSLSSKEQLKQKLQNDLFRDSVQGQNSINSPLLQQLQAKQGIKINSNIPVKNNSNSHTGFNRLSISNSLIQDNSELESNNPFADASSNQLMNPRSPLIASNNLPSRNQNKRATVQSNYMQNNPQDNSRSNQNYDSSNPSLQKGASPIANQSSSKLRSNSKDLSDQSFNQSPLINISLLKAPNSQQQQLPSEPIRRSVQKQLFSLVSENKPDQFSSTGMTKNQQVKPPYHKSIVSSYAVKSKPGALPGKPIKTNQDSYIITTNYCKNRLKYFFGICDGHGVNGHLASQYIKKVLCTHIETFLKQLSKDDYGVLNEEKPLPQENFSAIEQSLTSGFLKTASSLLDSGIDITFSGSTCVGVYVTPQRFWCANIGDSRAIVGRQDSKTGAWSNQYLSIDHKPDLPKECERIIRSGGRVDPFKDQNGNPIGPPRVWMRHENIPGLAMSRSFGDYVASQVGVIPEPEVLHFDFNQNDKFLVVASDGIWEFLSNEDVVNMISPFYAKNDPDGACEKLVKEATAIWKREDEVIDDITIIVVFLNK